MADKRMFAKTVIDSDDFLDMPLSTQALYFHLAMRADDDGFINNPRKVQRMVGAADDDFRLLLAKNFVIPFESGVCVIKHWRMHNNLRKDRYKETVYLEEKAHLFLKGNKAYTLKESEGVQIGIPDDNQTGDQSETQISIDKKRIDIYSAFFERMWVQYPNKRGKGRISDKKKKELYELVGEEQFERCIQRYVDDLSQNDWRKPQNGSTFFNSGYVDYLDVNYSKETAGHERMQRCEDGTFKLM